MHKLPVAMVFAVGALCSLMASIGGRSLLLFGLAEFSFTIFAFLVHMAVYQDLTLGPSSFIRKVLEKIKGFLTEEEVYFGVKTGKFFESIKIRLMEFFSVGKAQDDVKHYAKVQVSDTDLIEIHTQKTRAEPEAQSAAVPLALAFLYIASFITIAIWRIFRTLSVLPLIYRERFSYGIVHTVLLFFFFCIIVIYLKLKLNTDMKAGDKASYGMLTLFAYTILVFAAVIGINTVLNIEILIVLQWLCYAASVYIILALALNIMLSVLRNDLLKSFNYTIFPKSFKISKASDEFFDSYDVRVRFSLKSLYTIKYTLKIIPGIILSLVFVLFLSTTVFIVQPHQQAAIYRQGRLESIKSEGLHFKLPWPIDISEVYDVYRLDSMQIGYQTFTDSMNFLWDQRMDGSEYWLLLGNGNELVAVNMKLSFYISDLHSYLTTYTNPKAILSAAALEALMHRTAATTLDTFLTVDRDLFSASILDELSAYSRNEGLGLSIVQVIIESIHPPFDIAYVYQMVVSAAVDKQTYIINALSDAERLMIDAQRQSRVAVDNALAEQRNRVSAAQNEMAVYYTAMQAYAANPQSFRLNQYLNVFERVIDNSRTYVFSPGAEGSIPRSFVGSSFAMDAFRGAIDE